MKDHDWGLEYTMVRESEIWKTESGTDAFAREVSANEAAISLLCKSRQSKIPVEIPLTFIVLMHGAKIRWY